ncbi:MAG TPA: glycosyltransferase [Candidatus Binatia bacterium]|nr:glycosyltransferase [Candidatus Binatia bacterium]
MRVAIVTPAIVHPERLYGAERHFTGMAQAFQRKVEAEWIQVPINETTWEMLLQGYVNCYDLDLSRFDVVVSSKTPTYMAQHPRHICWLLHQVRVFYDRFDDEYGKLPAVVLAEKQLQREAIHHLDNLGLQRVRRIFTNGGETARRLKLYNGFDAEVLHPPVFSQGHYCGSQDYFLLPGRLHRWKRVDLAIRAMQHLPNDVTLLIAGTGEDELPLRELAGRDPRIRFLGFVNDAEMLKLYADALAVLFIPREEDFGYITVEAMLSHKPVIVCKDSGEPALLVRDGHSGFVVAPDPAEVARAMSILADNRALARSMGESAYESAPPQSWDRAVERLLEAAWEEVEPATASEPLPEGLPPLVQTAREPVRVLVACNQVLQPAVGGGRVRVTELCKGMAAHFRTDYLGAYDWPGPSGTDDWPVPNWHCKVFALSRLQYRVAGRLQRYVPGGSVIDVTFPWMTRLSPDYVAELHRLVAASDVVIFPQPWPYPLCKRLLKNKLVIFDSHNFEYGLRSQLLSSTWIGRMLAASVRRVEGDLSRRADQIWVVSWQDAEATSTAYGVPLEKFRLVPNCADTRAVRPATAVEKAAAKAAHGWTGHDVAVFVASGYRPNTEAAAFIIEQLAPAFPEMVFAIVGGVGEDYLRRRGSSVAPVENAKLLGVIEEEELHSVLRAADIALNPVDMGSGTNLKLVQYMAAGLAIVSTETGIRGIESGGEVCAVVPRARFVETLQQLCEDPVLRANMGARGRREAERNYDWARTFDHAAQRINGLLRYQRRMEPPFFSVVIPSYNRRELLLRNLQALMRQSFPDFEVVVVDQSNPPVEIPEEYRRTLSIRYVYSERRGPALARNKGIREASGHVVAFTDDDCIPEPDWLEKAARHFDEAPIAGLEGRVRSEKVGDPHYRTVSNVGFEGIGFMTANMFYRRDLLLKVNGFDERFPDAFREDTDLAWRIQEFGEIPHGRDAVVFHPPHPVTIERESQVERARMFGVDPILFERHPDKYIALLRREGHYRYMPGFWRYFVRGLNERHVQPPVTKLLQQLRIHDPEWWALVTGSNGSTSNSALTSEDLAAVRSLLRDHMVSQEFNA